MQLSIEQIAQLCHEANRAYCLALGDNSKPSWEEAPGWQKQSAVQGVQYRLENLTVTPEEMHQNWSKHKEADGWVYGPEKNAEAKTHPCMVPYAELPVEQKAKDYIFSAIVVTAGKLRADCEPERQYD